MLEQIDQLKQQPRVEKRQGTQGELAQRSWMNERKRLQEQLRDIEKFTDVDPLLLDGQKERWQQELQQIRLIRSGKKVSKKSESAGQQDASEERWQM